MEEKEPGSQCPTGPSMEFNESRQETRNTASLGEVPLESSSEDESPTETAALLGGPRVNESDEEIKEAGTGDARYEGSTAASLARSFDDTPIHARLSRLHSKMRPLDTLSTSTGMFIDGQNKYVSHQIDPAHECLEILFLSDVQYGHVNCNVDKFVEYRDWILSKPNRYCFFGGDMVDAWRIGSPGTGYDNFFSPETQFYKFCELAAPLRQRVLGFVGGNHERRGLAGGFDLGSLIATALRLPYSAGGQAVALTYGEHKPFRAYLWHGRGSARTAGARVNMTLAAVPNDDAQVYFSGHIHWAHIYAGWHAHRNHNKKRIDHEKYYVVSASSFLRFWGGYGEVAGMTYAGLLMPVLLLYRDGRYRVEM